MIVIMTMTAWKQEVDQNVSIICFGSWLIIQECILFGYPIGFKENLYMLPCDPTFISSYLVYLD